MAAQQPQLARAIAEAVYKISPRLILYGLAGSELIRAGRQAGLATASEVFADRTYQADGSLTSRRLPDALVASQDEAIRQVIRMVKAGQVLSRQGVDVAIQADTICIHGDGAHAPRFARAIRAALEREGVKVQAPEPRANA
jgi:UPF0271 protein